MGIEGRFLFVCLFARVEDKWLMLSEVSSDFVITQLWSESIHVTNLSISTMLLTMCHVECQRNSCCFVWLYSPRMINPLRLRVWPVLSMEGSADGECYVKRIQTMLVGPLASKLTFLTQSCCSAVNDSSLGPKSSAMSVTHFSEPRVMLVLWGCRGNL